MIKSFNVAGLQEMSVQEMRATDGGILPLLAVGAALLLSGCVTTGGNNTVREATDGTATPDTTAR